MVLGYPASMMHIKAASSQMVNMDPEKDTFGFGTRTTVYETREVKKPVHGRSLHDVQAIPGDASPGKVP